MKLDFERMPLGRDTVAGRTVLDGMPVHVHDLTAEAGEFPRGRDIAVRLDQRTVLGLPLLREGQAMGCLFLRRTEVSPFSDKQIALLQTFAAQAVIAIENTRLFNELRQRTDDLRNRCSSRPPPPTCSRSSAASPGDWSRCSKACSPSTAAVVRCQIRHNVRDLLTAPIDRGRRRQCRSNSISANAARNASGDRTRFGRVARTKKPAHVADARSDRRRIFNGTRTAWHRSNQAASARRFACRCSKDDELIGAIGILRQRGSAVHRQADRAGRELRRAGGHRHREHAAAQRAAQIAAAADRDLRGAAGHHQLAGRPGAGVRGHAEERDTALRGRVRHASAVRR